jgi:hypothetical protein
VRVRTSAAGSRHDFASGRRGFAFVLALALIAVQMLGLAHRIVHADRTHLAAVSAAAALGGIDAPVLKTSPHRSGSWLLALFAGHDPTHDCDAFDQMSSGDVTVDVTFDLAAPPPAPVEACFMPAAWHLAAQAQGFLARAPPLAA